MSQEPKTFSTHLAFSVRVTYILLGWLFFGLGMLGVLLPVLPTTPFLLLSLWAFSNGSDTLHHWLYTHKTFGPTLQRWHQYRIIPVQAKILIVVSMLASLIYLTGFSDMNWQIILLIGVVMLIVASYLLTRPSSLQTEKT
ncbi:MAG: YbaN family protein [Sedimenticola sp.]|uniref:Inner membrane protein n=1 Tax=Sedimenticola thiotaurini TaxID=1543721 RepID=A0A558CT14_9GAMM|nr:YbaN family protein [Sedimenticola sp.]MCW8949916.1 YbaN family protein [Sedimenticola sp.]MDF1530356.1 YbaN family protein [Sedimenticola sp.]TVT51905.1 MAG: DUF454 domain-containing protein [Sedimenticola thiotaurini]